MDSIDDISQKRCQYNEDIRGLEGEKEQVDWGLKEAQLLLVSHSHLRWVWRRLVERIDLCLLSLNLNHTRRLIVLLEVSIDYIRVATFLSVNLSSFFDNL